MIARPELVRLRRFCLVGGLNTLVDGGVFALLNLAGLSWAPAHTVSYSAGVVNSFVWNRFWTFERRGRPAGPEMLRFVLLNLLSWGLALGTIAVLTQAWAWPVLAAKVGAIAVSLLVNFAGSRLWVFRV